MSKLTLQVSIIGRKIQRLVLCGPNLYRKREQIGMGPQSIPFCAMNILRLVVSTRTLRVWWNEAKPNVGNCCRVRVPTLRKPSEDRRPNISRKAAEKRERKRVSHSYCYITMKFRLWIIFYSVFSLKVLCHVKHAHPLLSKR